MAMSLLAIKMDEDVDDRKPNPLLIPLVLEKVFEHVDINNLATCRKVCRTWKMEARPIMRKLCCIKFTSIDQIKSYIDDFKDSPPEVHEVYQFGALANSRYRGFVSGIRRVRMAQMMENTGPYFTTAGYRQVCQDTLRLFFNIFGNRIKVLELDSDFDMDIEELSRVLSSRTEVLESLSMTIRHVSFHRLFLDGVPFVKSNLTTLSLRSDVAMVPVSLLRDFFAMAPNLRKITCLPLFCAKKWAYSNRQPRPGKIEFIRVLFHTIVMGPEPPRLAYLSNLDINLQLTEVELQGLITKAYPLNSIKLGICSDVQGRTLATLLNAGRNLLVRVSLNFHPNSNAASYGRYDLQLQQLRYLCLCGFKASVSFIRNSPALKTLIIGNSGNLARAFPVYEIAPHNLQDLFVQWDNLEDSGIIGRITQCFPKLKTFSMRKGNDDVLREIYLSMPYLQSLTILGCGATDAGITGISEMVYQDIAESGSLSMAEPGKLRTSMSIGTLSRLRKLHLQSELITDVSIFLGIGSCVQLQHLHLQCSELTDYCLHQIVKFPYLTSLNVVSCGKLTMENKLRMRDEFRAQGRQVSIEWTPEEVMRESQRRALILPELPHDYYQQALLGIEENRIVADADVNALPEEPDGDLPELSDSDDDDEPHRERIRHVNLHEYALDYIENFGEYAFHRQRQRNPFLHYNRLRGIPPRNFQIPQAQHQHPGVAGPQFQREREEIIFGIPQLREQAVVPNQIVLNIPPFFPERHPLQPQAQPMAEPPQGQPMDQPPNVQPIELPPQQPNPRPRILDAARERILAQFRYRNPLHRQLPQDRVVIQRLGPQGQGVEQVVDADLVQFLHDGANFQPNRNRIGHVPNPNPNQNVNRPQIGPQNPMDYPPPIPADLDDLDDVEM